MTTAPFLPRTRLVLEVCGLTAFLIFLTILRVGDPRVRLANAISDDHPTFWAQIAKDPAVFEGDPILITAPFFEEASLQNWFATYWYHRANFSLAAYSWFLVLFQNVALGLALLVFCRTLCPEPTVYLSAAVATFAARPWGINLAFFPDVMYVPYPAHFVLSLLVLGFVGFLSGKRALFLTSLVVAALIHPLQTLHLLGLLGLICLFDENRWVKLRACALDFAVVGGAAIVPQLKRVSGSPHDLGRHEYVSYLLENLHVAPWKIPMIWGWMAPTLFGLCFFTYFALGKSDFRHARHWVKAGVVATLLGIGLQTAGAYFEIPYLLLSLPMRVTVLVSVLLTPILFVCGINALNSQNLAPRLAAGLVILVQAFSSIGCPWGLWATVIWGNKVEKKRKHLALLLLGLGLFIFLVAGRPMRDFGWGEAGHTVRNFLAPATHVENTLLLFLAGVSLLVIRLSPVYRRYCLLISAVLIITVVSWQSGRTTQAGPLRDEYELQDWANHHTAPGSLFLSNTRNSFRALSLRPIIYLDVGPQTILGYSRDRRLSDWNAEIKRTMDRLGRNFDALGEAQIKELGSHFNARYLIRPAEAPPLSFTVAYRNPGSVIYQLP